MSVLLKLSVLIFFFLSTPQLSQCSGTIEVDDLDSLLDTSSDNYDDRNFTFLITGGYRPENHTLAKYIVSLRTSEPKQFFGDNHFCGGIIIGPRTILTAAHCLRKQGRNVAPQDIVVVAGTPCRLQREETTRIYNVSVVVVHSSYRTLENDIGLLKLIETMEIDNKTIEAAKLSEHAVEPGTKCTTIGWGRTYEGGPLPDELLYADLKTWSKIKCYKKLWRNIGLSAPKGVICTSDGKMKTDACQGDSGGPLFCNGKVAGVTSFNFGCGTRNYPTVFTSVSYFYEWIERGHGIRSRRTLNRNLILFAFFVLGLHYKFVCLI